MGGLIMIHWEKEVLKPPSFSSGLLTLLEVEECPRVEREQSSGLGMGFFLQRP